MFSRWPTRYDQNQVVLWYGLTRCWCSYSRSSLKIQKMLSHRNIQYDLIDSRQHDALWIFAIMNHTCKVEPQLWNISCLSSYTVFRLTKDRANIWSNTEFIHGTMKTKHCRLGPCLSEEAMLYSNQFKGERTVGKLTGITSGICDSMKFSCNWNEE